MGSIDVNGLSCRLPTGHTLFEGVSFKVSRGEKVALVGANGVGKTTLFRRLAEGGTPDAGSINITGSLAYMNQAIGMQEGVTMRDLYLSLSPFRFQSVAARLAAAEHQLALNPSEENGIKYARHLAGWEEVGGYQLEVQWAEHAYRAIGLEWRDVADRLTTTFSGGEQKRLALELLLRGEAEVLLLDEPDNFLDVPAKQWLSDQLNATRKTVLYISHDRELLAQTSSKVVTLEANGAWTHGASFATWSDAREARRERLDDEQRRWAEERKRLHRHMREMKRRAAMSDANASRARAAETRLRHYDHAGPPPDSARDQNISMGLLGARSGKRVVIAEQLELTDLTYPFDLEIWFGDRLAVIGNNGTGKSHFLRLLGGHEERHEGDWRLGARVITGLFSQTNDHPELVGRELHDILWTEHDLQRGAAFSRLARYELETAGDQTWETLSGGQQARFQILLLELSGANLLLLDEPTDNLDVASAEALEAGLAAFEGTVIAVSHDRWFLRSFDAFLIFDEDGEVRSATAPDQAWVVDAS
ncbi:MAG: ATP-binding cassette domain-containing protein [Acidimicrobiales bacterium]